MPSSTITAACSCGQLTAVVNGEPVRVSVCHCRACQRRTGSAFGAQVRFKADDVVTTGSSTAFTRVADSGNELEFHFCPSCGATVFYMNDSLPGFIGIPLGAFADPDRWRPAFSVYEESKHPWVELPRDLARS